MTLLARRILPALGLAVIVAGCAMSPPANYYTLIGPATAASSSVPAAPYMIEVLPVSIPAQADQPQIMLRTSAAAVTPMYSDRWSSPLGDELREALSYALTRELGALDVQTIRPVSTGVPVWRIQVDVQRFDMVLGGPALLDATWRVRPIDTPGESVLCRSIVQETVAGRDIAGLVAGQQRAISQLAATIAAAVRAAAGADAANAVKHSQRSCNYSG